MLEPLAFRNRADRSHSGIVDAVITPSPAAPVPSVAVRDPYKARPQPLMPVIWLNNSKRPGYITAFTFEIRVQA